MFEYSPNRSNVMKNCGWFLSPESEDGKKLFKLWIKPEKLVFYFYVRSSVRKRSSEKPGAGKAKNYDYQKKRISGVSICHIYFYRPDN